MTKEQFFACCPITRVSFKTPEGLACNAEAILINHIHAAFDDEANTRNSDCTCTCGRCCQTTVGDSTVHWCINPDCENFEIRIASPGGGKTWT